jgi:N-ethylmaleimide reductase
VPIGKKSRRSTIAPPTRLSTPNLLIDQFLRDGSNRRTDQYGGTLENRVRFSPTSGFNDMRESRPQSTFEHAAVRLSRFALAYLHAVDSGEPFDYPALDKAA